MFKPCLYRKIQPTRHDPVLSRDTDKDSTLRNAASATTLITCLRWSYIQLSGTHSYTDFFRNPGYGECTYTIILGRAGWEVGSTRGQPLHSETVRSRASAYAEEAKRGGHARSAPSHTYREDDEVGRPVHHLGPGLRD